MGWRPSLAAIALLAAPAPLLPQDDVARIGSEACPAEPEAFVMPTTGVAFTLPPDPDQAACAEPAPPPPPIRPPAPSLFRMVALPVGDTAPRQKWELARLGEVAEHRGPWDELLSEAARMQSGDAVRTGMGWELDAIAAVVIGGTSLNGGLGKITGTVIGVLILGVVTSGFTFLRIDAYYQEMIKGVIIVVAVVADVARQRKRSRS